MAMIDRVGTFRGKILDSGVGTTKNGFPFFAARLQATERYVTNQEEIEAFELDGPGWVDWSEYDQEITARLTMFKSQKGGGSGMEPSFQLENVQKAVGGFSTFSELGTKDLSDTEVVFWVEENEYNGNVSLQVTTIDTADASPVRGMRTLDKDGLSDLDTRFGQMLAGSSKPSAAKKPATKKAAKKTAKKAVTKKAAAKAEPEAAEEAPFEGDDKPAAPAAAPPKPKTKMKSSKYAFDTMEDAWEHVYAQVEDGTDDDAIAEAWIEIIAEVSGGKDESEITSEEWGVIAENTIARVS